MTGKVFLLSAERTRRASEWIPRGTLRVELSVESNPHSWLLEEVYRLKAVEHIDAFVCREGSPLTKGEVPAALEKLRADARARRLTFRVHNYTGEAPHSFGIGPTELDVFHTNPH